MFKYIFYTNVCVDVPFSNSMVQCNSIVWYFLASRTCQPNSEFHSRAFGCLFFAMSIVKIRLQKVRLNFHRRNGPRCFERVGVVLVAPATPHNTVAKKRIPLCNTWYNILYDTIVILPPVVGNSIIVQIRRGVANIIIIRFINLLCAMHLAPYSIIIRYRSEL